MGNELDQMYVDKKQHLQEFDQITKQYSRFLAMVTMRIEALVRRVLINTYQSFEVIFSAQQHSSDSTSPPRPCNTQCRIELKLGLKEGKIECDPNISTLS